MTLGGLRQLGVRGLLLICLDPKCRHEATMGVDDYADEIELPSFAPRMACSQCGGKVAVRPNWKEMRQSRHRMCQTNAPLARRFLRQGAIHARQRRGT